MGLTTFAQAKEWVGPGFGDCQPSVTAEVVNACRQHWYNWYKEVGLFLDVVECFAVKTYCLDCNECRESYRGITLPRECQNVEAMWLNDWPVRMHSSWREYQMGLTAECDCRLQTFEVPGVFSTFDDIPHGSALQLVVVALDPADNGKRFVVRGVDSARRPYSHEFALSINPQETPNSFISIDARGGVIKATTVGRVILMSKDGRMFGRYEPDETVPAYRRQKVIGVGLDCGVVNVRSARRYYPLHGDDDVVETDNRMGFDAMARYLREYRRVEKTSATLVAEKDHLATARSMLMGEKDRDAGRATQTDVKIAMPSYRGKTLSRFGRCPW